MLYRVLVIFLLALMSNVVRAQSNLQKPVRRYVSVPSENTLLVVASQPSAPVRFEDAKLFIDIDRLELAISYRIRNVGTKPIRYVTPVMWTSFGTGGTLADQGPSSGGINGELLLPGDTFSDGQSYNTVSLTDDLRDRLRLRGSMRAMVVVMVGRVTFSDGSSYDDEATSKALLTYFEDLSDKIERLGQLEKRLP